MSSEAMSFYGQPCLGCEIAVSVPDLMTMPLFWAVAEDVLCADCMFNILDEDVREGGLSFFRAGGLLDVTASPPDRLYALLPYLSAEKQQSSRLLTFWLGNFGEVGTL